MKLFYVANAKKKNSKEEPSYTDTILVQIKNLNTNHHKKLTNNKMDKIPSVHKIHQTNCLAITKWTQGTITMTQLRIPVTINIKSIYPL